MCFIFRCVCIFFIIKLYLNDFIYYGVVVKKCIRGGIRGRGINSIRLLIKLCFTWIIYDRIGLVFIFFCLILIKNF